MGRPGVGWPRPLLLLLLAATVVLTLPGSQQPAIVGSGGAATTSAPVAPDEPTTATSEPPAPTTTSTTSVAEAVAAGICPPTPTYAEPAADRPVYTVRMRADPASGRVEGDLTVRFTPDLPIDRLVFRLWPNGPRPASIGARLDVGAVTSEGSTLEAVRSDPTTLEVLLGRELAPGRVVEVSMPWVLEVPGAISDRISKEGDSLRLGSFLPLLSWEPGVGWSRQPPTSGFAEAVLSPVADWTVAIEVPPGYGVLASALPGADGLHRARALRDFAVSVGRFELQRAVVDAPNPVEVVVGVHAGVGESPSSYLERVVAALTDLSRRYGPYPWPSYTLAITPGLGGGIEFPGHVMQGPETIGRTTPHEVAHMWFYGLVGNDQGRDPWMDEGLATFAEAQHEGVTEDLSAYTIPEVGRGRAGEPMTYWEPRQDAYYRSVYIQPADALAELGDWGAVDCALRHYVAEHAHRIATGEQLVAVLERFLPGSSAVLAQYGLPR